MPGGRSGVRPRAVAARLFVVIVCLGAWGCDFSSVVSQSPAPVPIRIHLFSGNECPLVGLPRRLTFRIDAAAGDQVVAIDETATTYRIWWPEGFRGGTADDPVVRDRLGLVVARDGEVMVSPVRGFPKLHGYSVCSGGDDVGAALWVQLQAIPL